MYKIINNGYLRMKERKRKKRKKKGTDPPKNKGGRRFK
jgi:hypothetical protein